MPRFSELEQARVHLDREAEGVNSWRLRRRDITRENALNSIYRLLNNGDTHTALRELTALVEDILAQGTNRSDY